MEYSRSVVETVSRTGKAVLTTNAQTDPRFSEQRSVMQFSLRSVLCVPLKVKDHVLGVIYVDNRVRTGLFSERDRELLSAFAVQAAIAIENAQLYTLTDRALAARVAELEGLQRADRQLNCHARNGQGGVHASGSCGADHPRRARMGRHPPG